MNAWLLVTMAAGNALAFIGTGNWWFALGALGFVVGAAALQIIERIEARVVRNLSKTCMCPLCKANRSDE